MFTRVGAARIAGCRITVSVSTGVLSATVTFLKELTRPWKETIRFVKETDEQLAATIRAGKMERIRFAAPERVPEIVLEAANAAGGIIASLPVSGEGRLEMLWYLREQSVSTDYHRYGNLGLRANEKRAEVL